MCSFRAFAIYLYITASSLLQLLVRVPLTLAHHWQLCLQLSSVIYIMLVAKLLIGGKVLWGNPRGHEHSTEMQAFQHRKPLPRPHSHFKCSVIPSCLTKHFKWLAPVASPLAYYYFSMCSCAVLQDAILGQKMYMNVNCYGLTNQKRQCCHLFQKATSNSAINNQYDCQSIQGPGT